MTELTLPAESLGRQLQPVPMLLRDGGFNRTGESDQPSGGCRFPLEVAPLRRCRGKILYLLIFVAQAGRGDFSISLGKTRPFPCRTFARLFFRTFSVLLQTYPY